MAAVIRSEARRPPVIPIRLRCQRPGQAADGLEHPLRELFAAKLGQSPRPNPKRQRQALVGRRVLDVAAVVEDLPSETGLQLATAEASPAGAVRQFRDRES